MQAADAAGVEVAAWFPGDRYLVTASGTSRTILIWDVQTGVVVNRQLVQVGGPGSLVRFSWAKVEPAPSPEMPQLQAGNRVDGQPLIVIRADVLSPEGVKSLNFTGPPGKVMYDPLYGPHMVGGAGGQSRRQAIRLQRIARSPQVRAALAEYVTEQRALEAIYEGSGEMTLAQAQAVLPVLPKSHDERFSLRRQLDGLAIVDATGHTVRTLSRGAPRAYVAASLSPDGSRLVMVDDLKRRSSAGAQTPVHGFDISRSAPLRDAFLAGDYGAVFWLDADRYLVTPDWSADDRELPERSGTPAPARVIDAATATEREAFSSLCYLTPVPGGGYIGAALPNCRSDAGSGRGLFRREASGDWRPFAPAATQGRFVNGLAVSRDGQRLAVIVEDEKSSWISLEYDDQEYLKKSLVIVDLPTGAVLRTVPLEWNFAPHLVAMTPDNRDVVISDPYNSFIVGPDGAPRKSAKADGTWSANDGAVLLASSVTDGAISRLELVSGKALPPVEAPGIVAGGFVPGRPLFWAVSAIDGFRIFDTRTWTPLLATYQFDEGGYLTVTPFGRYDTNLGADSDRFRWVFDDAPFTPLAPQTFMRDYYEPRLAQRLLDCAEAATCETVFPPLRALASLNRTLPVARIVHVQPGPAPNTAVVDVQVSEGVGEKSEAGATPHSGLHDLRLFRDGRLVGECPGPVAPFGDCAKPGQSPATRTDVVQWRAQTGLQPGVHRFTVNLPSGERTDVAFSAYLFNEDRVKGDTVRSAYARGKNPVRAAKAYIIAIGEDAYDEAKWKLNFAVNDAHLTAQQLAGLPGRETHVLTLVSDDGAARARKAQIRDGLALLAGGPAATAARARLAAVGVSKSELAGMTAATPDDVVILSFSGHGWAAPKGDFYLLPSDAKADPGTDTPIPQTLISSAELTDWLRDVDAGEMAIIIDACNSAASVEAAGFKAGPFGDAGLGQLAFDKGIRVLAASQANDVALEDSSLRHGLLTSVLSQEGLDDRGYGQADLNGDGRITLDEWLRYAAARLPKFSVEVRQTGGSRAVVLRNRIARADPKPQEPSLFDFTGRPSEVVLRAAPAAAHAAATGRGP